MDTAKLVSMANQIAAFHRRKPEPAAVAEVALHLTKFWEPRMRAELHAFARAGGLGLSPAAHGAALSLAPDAGTMPDDPAENHARSNASGSKRGAAR